MDVFQDDEQWNQLVITLNNEKLLSLKDYLSALEEVGDML